MQPLFPLFLLLPLPDPQPEEGGGRPNGPLGLLGFSIAAASAAEQLPRNEALKKVSDRATAADDAGRGADDGRGNELAAHQVEFKYPLIPLQMGQSS